ncbi:MAG TPA: M23 family metallopeptidase, partial [Rhodothermales bacterium]|nr:M23 family metallopeptidase [Rhodothermales bacterium]
LRGGRFQVTIQTEASLAFPVAGKNSSAIRSVFGDPRDGGRRRHHGVDIFAPRGTPVLAAADGVVSRVRNGGLGGKTVWLRDRDGNNLYYAHLESQLVTAGMRVSVGDTVGLVGNTGNARTTPPHLHFGIYRNGPMNPYPFIHQPTTQPATLRADTTRLGQWARTTRNNATLRRAPDADADAIRALPRQTGLYVAGGTGAWYRVHLPDGTPGYLTASLVEPAQRPLRQLNLAAGQPVRTHPTLAAMTIDSLTADTAVPVLAQFDDFLYVASSSGRAGWIAAD